MTAHRDRALAYYEALDDGNYDALAGLLAAEFVHDRPDLTLEGRERFVRFMREERPRTDTIHELDGVYGPTAREEPTVVVRGRLLGGDGKLIVRFVDAFAFDGEVITRIDTTTR